MGHSRANRQYHGDTAREGGARRRGCAPTIWDQIDDTPTSAQRLGRGTGEKSNVSVSGFFMPQQVRHPKSTSIPRLTRYCVDPDPMGQFFDASSEDFYRLQRNGRIASTLVLQAVKPTVAVVTSPAKFSYIHQKTRIFSRFSPGEIIRKINEAVAPTAQKAPQPAEIRDILGTRAGNGYWLSALLDGPIEDEAIHITTSVRSLVSKAPHVPVAAPFAYISDTAGPPYTPQLEPLMSSMRALRRPDLLFGPLVEFTEELPGQPTS